MIQVIVVDDENDIADVLCEFLKIKGIDVLGRGKNGNDALTLYKKLKPDVVLMDLVMPEYDGFYGIEKIKKYDPKSKIIIVSASLTDKYVEKLLSMNISAISLKPYDLNNIIEIIKKVHANETVDTIPTNFIEKNQTKLYSCNFSFKTQKPV